VEILELKIVDKLAVGSCFLKRKQFINENLNALGKTAIFLSEEHEDERNSNILKNEGNHIIGVYHKKGSVGCAAVFVKNDFVVFIAEVNRRVVDTGADDKGIRLA
jgi:hypothetical protein